MKNQFRALAEDEVEFLDEVLESTRREEARVRKETQEGLSIFRKKQMDLDREAQGNHREGEGKETSDPLEVEEQWNVGAGRKRKRNKDKEGIKGVKVRRSSTGAKSPTQGLSREKSPSQGLSTEKSPNQEISTLATPHADTKLKTAVPSAMGLVDYGSDDD